MGRFMRAVIFMTGWGIVWGAQLGALAGTLIVPLTGTIFSGAWGLGLGATCGILAALLTALLYPMQPASETMTFYRRGLTLVIGLVTAVGAPILLLISTRGILWGDYSDYANWAFIPSMLAAFVLGGLAAANTASLYTHDYLAEADPLEKFGNVASTFVYFIARPAHLLWIVLFAGMYAGSHILLNIQYGYTSSGGDYFALFMTGVCVSSGIILLLSLTLGTLIGFLNRIYFVEYKSHWTMERYRVVIMVLVSGFVLVMLLAWAFTWLSVVKELLLVSAPLILLYVVWLARGYAERYYEMQGKPKRKGKPKTSAEEQVLSAE